MPYRFLTDQHGSLKEVLTEETVFADYLKEIKTRVPPGVNLTGDQVARLRAIWSSLGDVGGLMSKRILATPGEDLVQYGEGAEAIKVGYNVPIAYDVWYLSYDVNVLEFGNKTIDETLSFLTEMFDLVSTGAELKCLKCPAAPSAEDPIWQVVGLNDTLIMIMGAVYVVKEARFETVLNGFALEYPSPGPQGGSDYLGYIAIPVGQLGVMASVSLVTETMFSEAEDYEPYTTITPIDGASEVLQGAYPGAYNKEDIFAPWDSNHAEVSGENLITKGYVLSEGGNVEYPAENFPPSIGNVPYSRWMRYWISRENNVIIPGEFVAVLCRPWPYHVWWHNESSPFVYSGNWVETEFYTSGVITKIIEPEEDEIGNTYKIKIKNEEVEIKSTDFYGYELGDHVGVLKKVWTSAGQATLNSKWSDLAHMTGSDNWAIVPVSFYSAN